MRTLEAAFEPATLGPIGLRNRVIKSATFEGMTPGGRVSARLVEHHADLARGEVGLTTVAYGAVSPGARTFEDQLLVDAGARSGLADLAAAVHRAGGACALQLSHCGGFTRVGHGGVFGPSPGINRYGIAAGLPRVRPLDLEGMARIRDDFVRAAQVAVEAGFDAVELHLGHGYLLSQFISPATNRRRDAYGGDVVGRARFPLEVVAAVLAAVGERAAVLAKINLHDGFEGGSTSEDVAALAVELERVGVHGLVLSGGFTSRSPFFLLRGDRPLDAMVAVERSALQRVALRTLGARIIQAYPFSELFFLDLALAVRARVRLPLALLGGVVSRGGVARAMEAGFDFVAIARALLADPQFVRRVRIGELERSRCTACNRCVAEMDAGGVRCVLPEASAEAVGG